MLLLLGLSGNDKELFWTCYDRSVKQIITIDGPAASGKSSVARGLADALGLPFVSSGLLYRAATYLSLIHKLDLEDQEAVLDVLANHRIVLKALPIEPNRICCDNEDISAALHTDDVDAAVSTIAALPALRLWVNARLKEVKGSFVIEGRDMGSVVFPEARPKFYLTASAQVRAKRRVGERLADLASVEEALQRRDESDQRQLVPAADALLVDTNKLSLQEVIDVLLGHVKAVFDT